MGTSNWPATHELISCSNRPASLRTVHLMRLMSIKMRTCKRSTTSRRYVLRQDGLDISVRILSDFSTAMIQYCVHSLTDNLKWAAAAALIKGQPLGFKSQYIWPVITLTPHATLTVLSCNLVFCIPPPTLASNIIACTTWSVVTVLTAVAATDKHVNHWCWLAQRATVANCREAKQTKHNSITTTPPPPADTQTSATHIPNILCWVSEHISRGHCMAVCQGYHV